MPYIKVNISKINGFGSSVTATRGRMNSIKSSFYSTGSALDWDVKACSSINSQINQINNELEREIQILRRMGVFFADAAKKYTNADITGNKDIFVRTVKVPELFLNMVGPSGMLKRLSKNDVTRIMLKNRSVKLNTSVLIDDSLRNRISKLIPLFTARNAKKSTYTLPDVSDSNSDIVTRLYDFLSNALDGINKFAKDDDITVSGGLVTYISSLYKYATGSYEDGWDIASGTLSMVKNSAKLEDGIYKYYINTLKTNEAFALYNKWGGTINKINIFSNLVGFGGTTIDTVKTITDENSKWYDSTSQFIKLVGAGINTIGSTYITEKFGKMVISASTPGKNQILAVPKLVNADASGLKNATGWLTLVDSILSASSSGIKKYGKVSEDGSVDMADWGEIGIAFACNGLAKMPVVNIVSGITEASTGATVDDLADKIIETAQGVGTGIGNITNEWLNKHEAMRKAVRSPDGNTLIKSTATNVSMILATGDYIGEKVVDGAESVAGWFSGLKTYFANRRNKK